VLGLDTLRTFATNAAALVVDQRSGIRPAPRFTSKQAPSTRGPRRRLLTGQNCTVVLTDVVGFGAPSRTEHDRLVIRQATADMVWRTFASIVDAYEWDDRGDGLLIVVYPDVPTTTVLNLLMAVLPGELRRHNQDGKPGTQFQLRVAVTVGPVVADMMGLSGKDIIRAARMLDTPAFKKAMTRTGSALGVITSAFVYDTAIETGPGTPGAANFAPVRVQVKESRFAAWVRLFEPPLIDVA
jgi:class 3 adenylate cyclase